MFALNWGGGGRSWRVIRHMLFQSQDIPVYYVDTIQEPLTKPRIPGRRTANRGMVDAKLCRVRIQPVDDVMVIAHAADCANWRIKGQPKYVPTGALPVAPKGSMSTDMEQSFGDALKWHMDRDGTTVARLTQATGVTRSVVDKLLSRQGTTTGADNAMLLAAYWGKTVNQFVTLTPVNDFQKFENLLELLQPSERQVLLAQMAGMLRARRP